MSDHTDTLTDTERADLGQVVQDAETAELSLNTWHPCASCPNPGKPCACSGRPWLGPTMTRHIESIVAARVAAARAEAWDEGNEACCYPAYTHLNPYRALIEGADQ